MSIQEEFINDILHRYLLEVNKMYGYILLATNNNYEINEICDLL